MADDGRIKIGSTSIVAREGNSSTSELPIQMGSYFPLMYVGENYDVWRVFPILDEYRFWSFDTNASTACTYIGCNGAIKANGEGSAKVNIYTKGCIYTKLLNTTADYLPSDGRFTIPANGGYYRSAGSSEMTVSADGTVTAPNRGTVEGPSRSVVVKTMAVHKEDPLQGGTHMINPTIMSDQTYTGFTAAEVVVWQAGNFLTEHLTLKSIEAANYEIQADGRPFFEVENYDGYDIDRTYSVLNTYTSGAETVGEDRTIFFDEEDPDTYPDEDGFAYTLIEGGTGWLTVQDDLITAQQNTTVSSRTATINVSYTENEHTVSDTAEVFQYRTGTTFYQFNWRNGNSAGLREVYYDEGDEEDVTNLTGTTTDIEFDADGSIENKTYYEYIFTGASYFMTWRNGGADKGIATLPSEYEVRSSLSQLGDTGIGECGVVDNLGEQHVYLRTSAGYALIDGSGYNGNNVYVYCYLKDDDANNFNLAIDATDTASTVARETIVVDGNEYPMLILNYTDHLYDWDDRVRTIRGYVFSVYAIGDNQESEDIGCTVVLNYFYHTAVYNSSDGKYYENEYVNEMPTFTTEYNNVERNVYGAADRNDVTKATIGKQMTINVTQH